MATDTFSGGLDLDLSPVVHAAAEGNGRGREGGGRGREVTSSMESSLEETRYEARRRVRVAAPTVGPGDFSDLTMDGGELGGAGGKIKLFARRKRTVKFDKNCEFM